MARLAEFLAAPFVFLVMLVTIVVTTLLFFTGWCLGALVGGFRAGWRRDR